MLKTKTSKKKSNSTFKTVGVSVLITVFILFGTSAIGSTLILKNVISENGTSIIANAAMFLATMIGSLPILKSRSKMGVLMAYLMAAGLLLALLLLKMIAFPETAFSNWFIALSALIGTSLCAVISVPRKKRRYR